MPSVASACCQARGPTIMLGFNLSTAYCRGPQPAFLLARLRLLLMHMRRQMGMTACVQNM